MNFPTYPKIFKFFYLDASFFIGTGKLIAFL